MALRMVRSLRMQALSASSALYVAKRRGRDTIWRFTEGEAAGVFSAGKTAACVACSRTVP